MLSWVVEVLKMSFIKRITVIGEGGTSQVFKDKKKKRKSTRMLRPLEKVARRVLEAGNEMTDQALDRHNRSSRKKKDGWMKDLMKNTMKANQKAVKKLVKM